MKMKKIVSVALAGVMTLATAIPAFAADPVTKVSTSTTIPTVSVTVPATSVILNPYKVAVTGTGAYGETIVLDEQIYSPKYALKSTSNAPIAVEAAITATPASTLTLTANTPSENTKEVQLNVRMATTFDLSAVSDVAVTGADIAGHGSTAINLDAGDVTPAYLYYQFSGACTTPAGLASANQDPWTAKDTVGISIKWTFTPGSLSSSALSAGTHTVENCNLLLSTNKANAGSTVYVFVLGGTTAGTNAPGYKMSSTAPAIALKDSNGNELTTSKLKLTKVASLDNAPDCIAIYSFVVPAEDDNKTSTAGGTFELNVSAVAPA